MYKHWRHCHKNGLNSDVNSEAVDRNAYVMVEVVDRKGNDFELATGSTDSLDILEIKSEKSDEERHDNIDHSRETENVRSEYC